MLMTIAEAAVRLDLPPTTVRRMAQAGELPALKIAGRWRLHPDLLPGALPAPLRGHGDRPTAASLGTHTNGRSANGWAPTPVKQRSLAKRR